MTAGGMDLNSMMANMGNFNAEGAPGGDEEGDEQADSDDEGEPNT